jgi:hypothetical protein
MKKQLIIVGIVAILVCVGLSGCNQISNVFLTDEKKIIGTWNSEGIWFNSSTVIIFSSNGTFTIEFKLGTVDISLNDGQWEMHGGILTIEMPDYIPLTNYTYQFSEDNRTLTITNTVSNDSYILRKQ